MKAPVRAFNKEKDLVGVFSVIVKRLCEGSFPALNNTAGAPPGQLAPHRTYKILYNRITQISTLPHTDTDTHSPDTAASPDQPPW